MMLLAFAASPGTAQTALQLRWELKEDVFPGAAAEGASRAVFTLTNRGATPLPGRGWALYFSALHEPRRESVRGGVVLERVTGDLQRIVPAAGFPGVAPGQSVEVEYLTSLLTNVSFAPAGPYIVFDETPERGQTVDYVAVPLERPPQQGRDPRVVTPQAQYVLDQAARDIPLEALPPVFPTPLSLQKREGLLRLAAMPVVSVTPELQAEAVLAAEILRPHFAKPAGKTAAVALRLETGPVEGQGSPEAYELTVDPVEGITIRGNSPAGVFYGLQSLRGLLPAVPAPAAGRTLRAITIVDAPRFAYRGFMLDVARNFQPKAAVLRTLDLMARYKLNVLHFHLTDDEGWRLEIPSLPELTEVGARRGRGPASPARGSPRCAARRRSAGSRRSRLASRSRSRRDGRCRARSRRPAAGIGSSRGCARAARPRR
jgi:hexosaminidase